MLPLLFPQVRSNPLYTSMILAWSTTEVIRYSYYACNLLGSEPYFLLYLRYTTFYVLYPLGASSEAFLIYATLPSSSPLPGWQSWLHGMWKPIDYGRALLFGIWWPGTWLRTLLLYIQLNLCWNRPICYVYLHDRSTPQGHRRWRELQTQKQRRKNQLIYVTVDTTYT